MESSDFEPEAKDAADGEYQYLGLRIMHVLFGLHNGPAICKFSPVATRSIAGENVCFPLTVKIQNGKQDDC